LLVGQLWSLFRGGDGPTIERLSDGVVYVRLPTFDAAHYEGASGKGWPTRKPGDKVLIVDLRDNGGGSAEYGFGVLKSWLDERRTVPFDSIGAQIASSCLYPALRWNYPGAAGTQFQQQLLDRMAEPYPAGCPRTVETIAPKWSYLQHRFDPNPGDLRILVLVNSNCASDCELMMERLASLPETLIAGVNSYGVSQMIQPGYSVLPHTGLRYRIALGRSDPYGDNRSVEGYGLDVDVVVPDIDQLGRDRMMQLANVFAGL
jgi:C-terminal processing protease CtpA/Prc